MAQSDEPKIGIDAFLEADESEINQLVENQGEETDVPLEAPPEPEEKPAEEPPVEEEKPVEEPPPAEEEPPPAEEKPPEQKVETKPAPEKDTKGDGYAWRELRRMRREQREREAAEAAAKAKPPEKPADAPAEEEILDPIAQAAKDAAEAKEIARKAQERTDELERQNQARNQERDIMDVVVRQENAFKEKHPDYDEARNFLAEARIEQYDLMGKLDADADMWISQRPDLVERHAAEELGLNPDDYNDIRKAAKDLAGRILIETERQIIVKNAIRTGKNVAEVVYNLADKMGRKAAAAPAEEKPAQKSETAAKERIQKAKESEERRAPFTKSLSTLDARPSPAPKKITTRAELMKLPDDQMDALIAEMDQKDPDWFKNLED